MITALALIAAFTAFAVGAPGQITVAGLRGRPRSRSVWTPPAHP